MEQTTEKQIVLEARLISETRSKYGESEASETQYWLDIIAQANWLSPEQMKKEKEECNELLAIFTSIAKNFK